MVVGCQPLTGESMRWIKDTVSGLSSPHDAAARNRVAKMQKYVMQGGDVNKRNKLGDTPLHEACAYIRDNGDTSKGKRRKMVGKDRRKVGKKIASRALGEGGPLEMLELLINAGAHINAQNIVGDAPLHKAALNGRALSADHLIRAGADVNIRNEFAQTPLHAACVSGNIEVVQRLVQGGADTSAQDAAEDTPFHEACRHQYESIVIYLMGLVNTPTTSQGLELWEGLDPGWEKMLRSRAQARVEGAEERGGDPEAAIKTAQSPAGVPLSTPSTAHNSIQSVGSTTGPGSARTPSALQFGKRNSVTVQSCQTESMSPPRVTVSSSHQTSTQRPIAESEAVSMTPPDDITPRVTSGAGAPRARGTRRGRLEKRASGDGQDPPREYSTAPAEVLAWQATKVKSAQQGRLIEKAREALREEQREAAIATSVTKSGDDDRSVDTVTAEGSIAARHTGASRRSIDDAPRHALPEASSANGLVSSAPSATRPNGIASRQGKGPASTEHIPARNSSSDGIRDFGREGRSADSESNGQARETAPRSAIPTPPIPTTPSTGFREPKIRTPSRDGRRRAVRKGNGVALPSPRAREPGNHRRSTSIRSSSRRVSSRPDGDRRYLPPNGTSGGSTSYRPPSGADASRLEAAAAGAGATTRTLPYHAHTSRPSQSSSSSSHPSPSGQSRRDTEVPSDEGQPSVVMNNGLGTGSQSSDGAGSWASQSRECAKEPSPASRHCDGGIREDQREQQPQQQQRYREERAPLAGAEGRSSPSRSSRRSRRQSSGSTLDGSTPGERGVDESQRSASGRELARSRSSRRHRHPSGDGPSRRSSRHSDERLDGNGNRHDDHHPRFDQSDRHTSHRSVAKPRSGQAQAQTPTPPRLEEEVKASQPLRSISRMDSLSRAFEAAIAQQLRTDESVKSSTPVSLNSRSAIEATHANNGSGRETTKSKQTDGGKREERGAGRDMATRALIGAAATVGVPANSVEKVLTPKGAARPSKKAADDIGDTIPIESPSTCSNVDGHPASGRPKRRALASPRIRVSCDVSGEARDAIPARGRIVVATDLPVKRVGPFRTRPQVDDGLIPTSALDSASNSVNAGADGHKSPASSKQLQPVAEATNQHPRKVSIHDKVLCGETTIPRSISYDSRAGTSNAVTHTLLNGLGNQPPSRGEAASILPTGDTHSVCSTEDDLPPDIEALHMNGSGKTRIDTYKSFEGPARVIRTAEGAAVVVHVQTTAPMVAASEEKTAAAPAEKQRHTSWIVAARQTSSKAVAMAFGASKALLFSDSETETADESSSGAKHTRAALTLGSAGADLTKTSADESKDSYSDAWDRAVEDTLEAAADGAASAYIQNHPTGGRVINDAMPTEGSMVPIEGPAPTEESMPTLSKPAAHVEPEQPAPTEESMPVKQSAPSGTFAASPPPPRSTPVGATLLSVAASMAPRALPPGISEPAADGEGDIVAVSEVDGVDANSESNVTSNYISPAKSAGVVPSKAFFAAAAGNPGGLRSRSTLGRPGRAPAKVAMPIAGGRAAWNKFLANTEGAAPATPTGGEGSAAGTNGNRDAAFEARSPGGEASDAEGRNLFSSAADSEAESEFAGVDSRDPPRGFKEPVGLDGPNKGPAGAFSGNAMWRLAGGATSSTARAREGVAANGHGGYSNPLAAMRAHRVTGATGGARGFEGGGIVANRLVGLRGAVAVGGAGRVNSLARGGARGNGIGGDAIANPLLAGGAGGALGNTIPFAFKRQSAGDAAAPATSAHDVRTMRRTNTHLGLPRDVPYATSEGVANVQNGGAARPSTSTTDCRSAERLPGPLGSTNSMEVESRERVGSNGGIKRGPEGLHIGAGDGGQTVKNGFVVVEGGKRGGGLNGTLPPPPESRRARASQRGEVEDEVDRNPGQARVASVVMAIQTPNNDARQGHVIQDPYQHVEVSNVAEQGLVRLRRVKYSPR